MIFILSFFFSLPKLLMILQRVSRYSLYLLTKVLSDVQIEFDFEQIGLLSEKGHIQEVSRLTNLKVMFSSTKESRTHSRALWHSALEMYVTHQPSSLLGKTVPEVLDTEDSRARSQPPPSLLPSLHLPPLSLRS